MLKKIIHNTLANYLLKALHLTLNLIAVPILINVIGIEGFGVITFAAVLIGYFNVFDLGITQGVTKYVSESVKASLNCSIHFYKKFMYQDFEKGLVPKCINI